MSIYYPRSTPRYDSFYGGVNSLTGAYAWEADGNTTIRFRKPVKAGTDDKTDHSFEGELYLNWAHGQVDNFYLLDELKYHGGNRGQEELGRLSTVAQWYKIDKVVGSNTVYSIKQLVLKAVARW